MRIVAGAAGGAVFSAAGAEAAAELPRRGVAAGAPQFAQNLSVGRISWPQFVQNIAVPPLNADLVSPRRLLLW